MPDRQLSSESYMVIGPHDPKHEYENFGWVTFLGHTAKLHALGDKDTLYVQIDDEDQKRTLPMGGIYQWFPLTGEIAEVAENDLGITTCVIYEEPS